MKTLINKMTATLSNVVLFVAAAVMAGLGFAVLGALALFALLAMGVALIAAPFAALAHPAEADDAEAPAAA